MRRAGQPATLPGIRFVSLEFAENGIVRIIYYVPGIRILPGIHLPGTALLLVVFSLRSYNF